MEERCLDGLAVQRTFRHFCQTAIDPEAPPGPSPSSGLSPGTPWASRHRSRRRRFDWSPGRRGRDRPRRTYRPGPIAISTGRCRTPVGRPSMDRAQLGREGRAERFVAGVGADRPPAGLEKPVQLIGSLRRGPGPGNVGLRKAAALGQESAVLDPGGGVSRFEPGRPVVIGAGPARRGRARRGPGPGRARPRQPRAAPARQPRARRRPACPRPVRQRRGPAGAGGADGPAGRGPRSAPASRRRTSNAASERNPWANDSSRSPPASAVRKSTRTRGRRRGACAEPRLPGRAGTGPLP